jgi:hypothetical protein
MATAKAEVAAMLAALPDDSSLEDIQYHLFVLDKVKRRLQRTDSEGVISHQDAKARLGKWLSV